MYDDKYYFAAVSTAEAAADTELGSSDIPATVSAAATVLPASAVQSTCSSPQDLQLTSAATTLTIIIHIPVRGKWRYNSDGTMHILGNMRIVTTATDKMQGPDLQISYDLSYDYRKFIVR